MFFIMGISNTEKQLAFDQPLVCPCCGKFGRLEVYVTYMFFSLFFIPIIKWDKRYYAKTTCCCASCELSRETGRSIERGETTQLTISELQFSCKFHSSCKRCTVCGYEAAADFQFCPKCGQQL